MEDRCLIDHGKVDLLKAQSRIRSRFSRKAEGPVTFRREGHKRQRRKHRRIGQYPFVSIPAFSNVFKRSFPNASSPTFPRNAVFAPYLFNAAKEISRRSARIRFHRRISVRIRLLRRKIDQKLTKSDHIVHFNTSLQDSLPSAGHSSIFSDSIHMIPQESMSFFLRISLCPGTEQLFSFQCHPQSFSASGRHP